MAPSNKLNKSNKSNKNVKKCWNDFKKSIYSHESTYQNLSGVFNTIIDYIYLINGLDQDIVKIEIIDDCIKIFIYFIKEQNLLTLETIESFIKVIYIFIEVFNENKETFFTQIVKILKNLKERFIEFETMNVLLKLIDLENCEKIISDLQKYLKSFNTCHLNLNNIPSQLSINLIQEN
ncbi:hypothetical protein CWI39_0358p0020, partial [Hamiltosporidium magnivora]